MPTPKRNGQANHAERHAKAARTGERIEPEPQVAIAVALEGRPFHAIEHLRQRRHDVVLRVLQVPIVGASQVASNEQPKEEDR